MANNINSGKGGASNSRSRMLVLITVVVLIIAAVIGFIGLRGSDNSSADNAARVAAIPGIQSIPGSDKAAAQYVQTVQKSNQIEANQALQKGSSSIPTILRSSTFETGSFTEAGGGYGNSCEHIQNKFPYCFSSAGADNQGLGVILHQIAQACRPGVSPSNCRAAIDKLVQDNRLTKEEGDRLFSAYAQTSSEDPAVVIQGLVKNNMIDQKQAQDIDKSCHKGSSDDACLALLRSLVVTGKLSSSEGMRLMQAYGRPLAPDAFAGAGLIKQLLNAGKITPEVARQLMGACLHQDSCQLCKATITELQASKKITPDVAQALLSEYTKACPAPASAEDKAIANLLSQDKVSPEAAGDLGEACRQGVPDSICQATVDKLVSAGKISAEQQKALLANLNLKSDSCSGAGAVAQLVKNDTLQASTAAVINKACCKAATKNMTSGGDCACSTQLQASLSAGEINAADVANLLRAYGQNTCSISNPVVKEVSPAEKLSNSGLLSAAAAQGIQDACKKGGSDIACSDYLKKMVADEKLTASQASNLLAAYDKPPVDFSKSKDSLADSPSDQGVPSIEAGGDAQLNQVLARQQAFIKDQTNKQKIQEAESAMQSQAAALFQAWYPPPLQTVVEGTPDDKSKNQSGGAPTGGSSDEEISVTADDANVETFKAGKIIFGMLNTQINSDQPGPVLASIVGGPLNGAKLLGTMAREDDKLLLRFTLISLEKAKTSGQVNIVAVSPETARTALASNVDRHYLSRYGSLFASSFIQGFGQAVQQSGQSTTSSINGTITSQPALSTKDKMLIAFGDTAQKMGDNLSGVINRQPTVTLNAGSSIGLLFLSDFKVNKDLLKHSTIQGIEDLDTEG